MQLNRQYTLLSEGLLQARVPRLNNEAMLSAGIMDYYSCCCCFYAVFITGRRGYSLFIFCRCHLWEVLCVCVCVTLASGGERVLLSLSDPSRSESRSTTLEFFSSMTLNFFKQYDFEIC
ncbi:hypothetical protein T492DRAFT_992040 [Pavlovales sp. CCMP2436]|nr:hypothetical protein T492DRAFT_992040 [Pavlovales sp. CCMP2436]